MSAVPNVDTGLVGSTRVGWISGLPVESGAVVARLLVRGIARSLNRRMQVGVRVGVRVIVGVLVRLRVGVRLGVLVRLRVGVRLVVRVGVRVNVRVGVRVTMGFGVRVRVAVGSGQLTTSSKRRGAANPPTVPVTVLVMSVPSRTPAFTVSKTLTFLDRPLPRKPNRSVPLRATLSVPPMTLAATYVMSEGRGPRMPARCALGFTEGVLDLTAQRMLRPAHRGRANSRD